MYTLFSIAPNMNSPVGCDTKHLTTPARIERVLNPFVFGLREVIYIIGLSSIEIIKFLAIRPKK